MRRSRPKRNGPIHLAGLSKGEHPVELRVPNKLTAETLAKSDRDEEVEYFDSVEEMAASWKDG